MTSHAVTRRLPLILEHLQNGLSVAEIGRMMGLTKWQITGPLYQRGMAIGTIRRDTIAVRTVRGVSRLFGVSQNTALRWVRDGHLRPTGQHRRGQSLLITDAALMDFIEHRDTWPLWDAGRITDQGWRVFAQEERRAARGRWVQVKEIAIAQHYHPRAAAGLVKRGLFPGAILVRDTYYVWRAFS